MRRISAISGGTILVLSIASSVGAQEIGGGPLPPIGSSAPAISPSNFPPLTVQKPEDEIVAMQKRMEALNQQLVGVQKAQPEDDKVKKQIELLQKQIEVQQKMIQLLTEQMKKQPSAGSVLEKIQTQVTILEARSKQAAQRDQEIAQHIDNIVEHQDAFERTGPTWPAPLKELFLPSGNNETPLSIYGTLAFGYSKIFGDPALAANGAGRPTTPGGFYFGEFTPDFVLKLNERFFLEAEIGIGADGSVASGSFAQADFFVNDWLTIIAGHFVAPIGFYNQRLNNPWINKLPGDAPGSGPLLWQQVLPPFAGLGVQAAGAFYLGNSPVKMEYNAYVTNGLNFTPGTPAAPIPSLNELANLQNMGSTFAHVADAPAVGGRLGLWWPGKGLAMGVSAMYNPAYIAGFDNSLNLLAVDLSYHMGNWDARTEYGMMNQQTKPFLKDNINRQGVYAQLAYRPRDSGNRYLQNVELVYRYTFVDFKGIAPAGLDLTTFATPIDVPVRRQQNEIGLNYYFYPRMVLKCAYQINDEPGFHLHDDQFIAEFAWGW